MNTLTIKSGFDLLRSAAMGSDIAPSVARAVVAGMMANIGTQGYPTLRDVGKGFSFILDHYPKMDNDFPQHSAIAVGLANVTIKIMAIAEVVDAPLAEAIEEILQNRSRFIHELPEHHPGVLQSINEMTEWLGDTEQLASIINLALIILRIASWPDPVGRTLSTVIVDVLNHE